MSKLQSFKDFHASRRGGGWIVKHSGTGEHVTVDGKVQLLGTERDAWDVADYKNRKSGGDHYVVAKRPGGVE